MRNRASCDAAITRASARQKTGHRPPPYDAAPAHALRRWLRVLCSGRHSTSLECHNCTSKLPCFAHSPPPFRSLSNDGRQLTDGQTPGFIPMFSSQFVFADSSYWYLPVYLEFSLTSISVSRLVLHLRETAEAHHSPFLNEATSISLSNLTTTFTPNDNHRHRHAADRGWDSRPSAAPQYSTLSVQCPVHPAHAYYSDISQVRLSLSGHLHDAQSHLSKTDPGALCVGSEDALCASNATDTLGHATFYASGIVSWKDDNPSQVESPGAPD
jgi:hypothetical protein